MHIRNEEEVEMSWEKFHFEEKAAVDVRCVFAQ